MQALMTRAQFQAAIDTGKPFTLLMADGNRYEVPTRNHIHIAPTSTFAVVFRNDDCRLLAAVADNVGT
ncbi:MAG: hypothetical protein ACFBZ8_05375 [Opitutales bacterium]